MNETAATLLADIKWALGYAARKLETIVLLGDDPTNLGLPLTNPQSVDYTSFAGVNLLAEGERDADNRLVEPTRLWFEPEFT